jgi:hypothetical protein
MEKEFKHPVSQRNICQHYAIILKPVAVVTKSPARFLLGTGGVGFSNGDRVHSTLNVYTVVSLS